MQAPPVVKKTLSGTREGCLCYDDTAVFILQNDWRGSSYRRLSITGLELNKLIGLSVLLEY